ncbi:helix-turn-helix domain-containing protein [Rhizobium sp. 2MFCol3.1]|uniref:helix-turn-helix domain-containing protein n=1 Tax=Rhizobium sp. 2MFCol3.1 TaxID=1246459 RepID=UPI00037552B7|nr:helix-turn-helix domain-containing protein [Rhizobium sp. 2MFCol3.1]
MSDTNVYLKSLGDISRIVHDGKDAQDVLERLAYAICFQSAWQSSSIIAVDEAEQSAVQIAHFSRAISDRSRPGTWTLDVSPTAEVVRSGKPLVIADALTDKRYLSYWTEAQIQRFRTVVLLPLRVLDSQGRPIVISIQSSDPLAISDEMMAYLETFANLAGMAVEKGQRLSAEKAVAARFESLLTIQQRLVTDVVNGASIDMIVELCQRHLNTGFIIADFVSGRAHAGNFESSKTIAGFLNSAEGWRQVDKLFQGLPPGRFRQRSELELTEAGRRRKFPVFAEAVFAGGETVGGIALDGDGLLDDDVIRAAESIWIALSVGLLRGHVGREARAYSASLYIRNLLEGNIAASMRDGEDWPHLRQSHKVFALKFGDKQPSSSSIVTWALERVLKDTEIRIAHGIVDDFLVLLVPSTGNQTVGVDFGERLLSELRRSTGLQPILIESAQCNELQDYPSAWRKTIRLAQWATKHGKHGRLLNVDAGVFGILADIVDYSLAEEFCNNALNHIRDHDAAHGTPFFETLVAVVRNSSRLQATADELNLHITTIRYRIERILELFDLDLRDSEIRFTIDMALRLDGMLKSSQGSVSDRI